MNLEELNVDTERKFIVFDSAESSMHTLKKSDTHVNVLYINVRSIRKNWDTMLSSINDILNRTHILILSEINVNSEEAGNYFLPGFKQINLCRLSGRGGGILLLYRKELKIQRMANNFLNAELLTIKLQIKNHELLILAFYRPPSLNVNSFNAELEIYLQSNEIKQCKNVVMIGDMNICYLTEAYGSHDYINLLHSNGMNYTIMDSTREEIMVNSIVTSCLDHVNVRLNQVDYVSFIIQEKIADHYIIGISLKTINQNIQANSEGLYKQEIIQDNLVNRNIQSCNWWPILDLLDPEDIYNEISDKFRKIYTDSKRTIKHKARSGYPQNSWMNNSIRAMIKDKNELWKQVKNNRVDTLLKSRYRRLRNDLTTLIRKTKRTYYFNLFNKNNNNIRKSWEAVNSLLNKNVRPTIVSVIKENFKLNNNEEIQNVCNGFGNSFNDIMELSARNMQREQFDFHELMEPSIYTNGPQASLFIRNIDGHTLLQMISKLKSNSSPGPDMIRARDIKNNFVFLKLTLIHLINRIIKTGKIPKKLKITYLRPIYKKGKKSDMTNYRPIGSISVIMKIMEHYLCHQLKEFCAEYRVISELQYGFVSGKSTVDLLDRFTNDICTALNSGRFIVAVSLDLSRAFDMVQYDVMLKKLMQIGVGGKLLKLLENYFEDRWVKVNIGNSVSTPKKQTCGLVQGSVLAPLLFNLYLNDLAYLKRQGKLLNYADDTLIYADHRDLSQATRYIQKDLNLSVKYFHNNYININNDKTQMIVFGGSKMLHNSNLRSNGPVLYCHSESCLRDKHPCQCTELKIVNSIKHLGVHLDSNMKFTEHIKQLSNLLRISLYKFFHLTHILPLNIKRIIYFSLVESILRYGISIYSSAPEYMLNPLKTVVKRITKLLFGDASIKTLGILDFDHLAKYALLQKYYYHEEFRKCRQTGYEMRNQIFTVPRFNNGYGKILLAYRIPGLLNELPPELRNLPTKKLLRNEIKNFYLNSM
jgi:hypothetical protein